MDKNTKNKKISILVQYCLALMLSIVTGMFSGVGMFFVALLTSPVKDSIVSLFVSALMVGVGIGCGLTAYFVVVCGEYFDELIKKVDDKKRSD